MIKSAKEVLAAGSVVEIVDAAVEMNRQINALTKEVEALKAALREKGLARIATTGDNNVSFEGTIGVAQIAAVKAAPKAKKGVDLLAAEAALPAEVYSALFTKRTVVDIADDFEVKVASLTTAQKAVVANLVEVVASTPRVNLK